jgi:lysophospholipase L1-like esterase
MTLRIAILGDSIAYGIGADQPSHTPAARVRTALAEHGVAAETRVFAVPGARSTGLGAQVRRAVLWRPHVAVVIIGANDLTHFVPHGQAATHLQAAVRQLRQEAEVVVAPAPDLSIVPHVPPAMRAVVQAGSRALRDAQVAVTIEEGGRVADAGAATSAAFAQDRSLFSADRFHPSSTGYRVIAEALMPAVLEAARMAS